MPKFDALSLEITKKIEEGSPIGFPSLRNNIKLDYLFLI